MCIRHDSVDDQSRWLFGLGPCGPFCTGKAFEYLPDCEEAKLQSKRMNCLQGQDGALGAYGPVNGPT